MSISSITFAPSDHGSLFIGGRWCTADGTYERFDPSDLNRSTGVFSAATGEHVAAAYDAASAAQPQWASQPAAQRADVLRRAADQLEARAEEAARRLTADMGKVIRDARGEVLRSVAIIRYFAGEVQQPIGETYSSADPSTMLFTVEHPLGVVCAITPWNFPVGHPHVETCSRAWLWQRCCMETGRGSLGERDIAHGSLSRGQLAKRRAQPDHRQGTNALASSNWRPPLGRSDLHWLGRGRDGTAPRCSRAKRKGQLELGGKNPAIVLADADLQDAALQVIRGAMLSTGQRCTATSRVYVQRLVAQEFKQHLKDQVEALVIGDPFDESSDIGPLAFIEQHTTVTDYLKLADDEQAEVVVGGRIDREGCFVSPTILAGVDRDSRLVREEIFGPVLIIDEVADFDAALELANDTEFGLSSAVFTRDIAAAMRFVRHAQSGIVHINRETAGVEPHVPFGGIKGSSSMSREQGKAARQFFTTTKTIYLRSP